MAGGPAYVVDTGQIRTNIPVACGFKEYFKQRLFEGIQLAWSQVPAVREPHGGAGPAAASNRDIQAGCLAGAWAFERWASQAPVVRTGGLPSRIR